MCHMLALITLRVLIGGTWPERPYVLVDLIRLGALI